MTNTSGGGGGGTGVSSYMTDLGWHDQPRAKQLKMRSKRFAPLTPNLSSDHVLPGSRRENTWSLPEAREKVFQVRCEEIFLCK